MVNVPAKSGLMDDIQKDIDKAIANSKINQGWDIAFRVGILLLGLTTVVCSGLATSDLFQNPKPMSLISTIVAGVSAALSSFAFTDFSFSKRQRVYERKANLLRSLHDQLHYFDPDEERFRKRLDVVRGYGDHSDPNAVL